MGQYSLLMKRNFFFTYEPGSFTTEKHVHLVTPIDRSGEQSELAQAFKKRRTESEAYYRNLEVTFKEFYHLQYH